MSIEDKPIIAIVGSLSKQGRSVAHSLLQSNRYRVRALTGNIDSLEAKNLAAAGAELISVPLNGGRRNDFVKAFQGSYGAFLVTPGTVPPETTEFDIGKEMADAVVQAGVQHAVFSTLENVDKISSSKIVARHFTEKARVQAYIDDLPIKSSFIEMAFFYTNLLEYYPPRRDGDTLIFPIYLPEHFRAPFVDPLTATGPAVLEIFDHPDAYVGKTMPVVGDIISPAEMVETFNRVSGQKAAYAPAHTFEEFHKNFPHFSSEFVHETMGMVEYAVKHGFFRSDRDLEWSRNINKATLNWEQFLKVTGWDGQKKGFGLKGASS